MSFIQAKPLATYDLYGPIHKAMRLSLTDLLVKLGRADPRDDQTAAALVRAVRQQLHLSSRHLHHEDAVIHPALEERSPGACAGLEKAHDDHRTAFDGLNALLVRIEAAGAERPALWRELYLAFSRFAAHDFEHMAEEELVTQPLLQSLFTDEEMFALEQRILASIAPDDMMAYLTLMVGAGSHPERVTLLRGVKAGAPAEAFDAVITFAVKPQMSAEEFQVLDWALGQA